MKNILLTGLLLSVSLGTSYSAWAEEKEETKSDCIVEEYSRMENGGWFYEFRGSAPQVWCEGLDPSDPGRSISEAYSGDKKYVYRNIPHKTQLEVKPGDCLGEEYYQRRHFRQGEWAWEHLITFRLPPEECKSLDPSIPLSNEKYYGNYMLVIKQIPADKP